MLFHSNTSLFFHFTSEIHSFKYVLNIRDLTTCIKLNKILIFLLMASPLHSPLPFYHSQLLRSWDSHECCCAAWVYVILPWIFYFIYAFECIVAFGILKVWIKSCVGSNTNPIKNLWLGTTKKIMCISVIQINSELHDHTDNTTCNNAASLPRP